MTPKDILSLLAVSALLGSSFVFNQVASPALGPVLTAFLRVLIAALGLLILVLAARQPLGWRRFGGWIALVGVLNSGLPFLLISYAQLHLTAGTAAILNTTGPLWTAVIGASLFGDAFTPRRCVGLLMGLIGVGVLVGWHPAQAASGTLTAVLAMLGATFCYGLASNLTHVKLHAAPPLGMVLGAMLTSSILLAPVAPFFPASTLPDARVIACVLALGLVCTGLAYALYLPLIVRLGGTRSASVSFLVPIFALVWSAAFLQEAITPQKGLACAIVLLGAWLILGLPLQFMKPAMPSDHLPDT